MVELEKEETGWEPTESSSASVNLKEENREESWAEIIQGEVEAAELR